MVVLVLTAPEPEVDVLPGTGTDLALGAGSRYGGVSTGTVEGTEPDDGPVEYIGEAVVAGPTTVEGAPYSSGAPLAPLEPQQPGSRLKIRPVVRLRKPQELQPPQLLSGPDWQPAWIIARPAIRPGASRRPSGMRPRGLPREAGLVFEESR